MINIDLGTNTINYEVDIGKTVPIQQGIVQVERNPLVEEKLIPNGIKRTFKTKQNFKSKSVRLFINGLKEEYFTEDLVNQITIEDIPYSDDIVIVNYEVL